MKFFVVLALVVSSAYAQKYSATQNANEIVITRPDPENPIQVIEGAYSYVSPDGQQINLLYKADENGFQPTTDHLPTTPPVPAEIQKALDIILTLTKLLPKANKANNTALPQQFPVSFNSLVIFK